MIGEKVSYQGDKLTQFEHNVSMEYLNHYNNKIFKLYW